MRNFRRLAACLAFGALAATCFVAGSEAKQKSWGEECKEKLDKKRDRLDCCWLKAAKCSTQCHEDHFGKDKEYDDCHDKCNDDEDRCKKHVKSAIAPGVSTPTRPRMDTSIDERVCCKTGIRQRWTNARDCQTRQGQVVAGRLCTNPALGTQSQSGSARICCQANGARSMTTPDQCQARQGERVARKLCEIPNVGVDPVGNRVLKPGPSN